MPPERRAAEALLGRIEIDQPSIVAEPVTVRFALSRHELVTTFLGDPR
jgi:hypothetical protein